MTQKSLRQDFLALALAAQTAALEVNTHGVVGADTLRHLEHVLCHATLLVEWLRRRAEAHA